MSSAKGPIRFQRVEDGRGGSPALQEADFVPQRLTAHPLPPNRDLRPCPHPPPPPVTFMQRDALTQQKVDLVQIGLLEQAS